MKKLIFSLLIVLLLSACGSGGGGDASPSEIEFHPTPRVKGPILQVTDLQDGRVQFSFFNNYEGENGLPGPWVQVNGTNQKGVSFQWSGSPEIFQGNFAEYSNYNVVVFIENKKHFVERIIWNDAKTVVEVELAPFPEE